MSTNANTDTNGKKVSMRARFQAFGGFLTNMVLPNIGAFIAWGIVTALFIPDGWIPNEALNQLVDPVSSYLLPLLLAFTGGRMVGGNRGGVLGATGTMGAIIGSDIPMFLGAMVIGPFGGWLMKKIDQLLKHRIPVGFEMIVNNFSIGIIGAILMIIAFLIIGPVVQTLNELVAQGVELIVSAGLLPLVSLINEPAKVLFLNNVIDQGIYYPLGIQQTVEAGQSIYFMLASNPGPGLGLLLAFTAFGKGAAKRTAPGAIIIHFFGGIHEMYFPYVLMKPLTIVSMILGGMSGIVTFQFFDAGLVGGPSPGSIFSYLALTPPGNFIGVLAGVIVAAIVSFLVTSLILRFTHSENDFDESKEASTTMKAEGKKIDSAQDEQYNTASGTTQTVVETNETTPNHSNLNSIAFACDAGMGSSAMGATAFKRKLKESNIEDIQVNNYRIEEVPEDTDLIVVHKDLKDRTLKNHPETDIVTITSYLQDPTLDKLLEDITSEY